MAQIDRFMIAPLNTGLQTDLKPWLIPDDAFQQMIDAYIFRGRVRKRFGASPLNLAVPANIQQLYTRLRMNLGNTDNITGNASYTVPGTVYAVGQMFSVGPGTDIFTVVNPGTPAAMLTTGAGTGTYNTSTGAVVITGATPGTPVYFYPSTPVMGFGTYEQDNLNNEPLFAYDTQFAYQYMYNQATPGWEWLFGAAEVGANQWSSQDYQFMWTSTYRGLSNADYYVFATNYNYPLNAMNTDYDYLRYYDGTFWNYLYPAINGLQRMLTCRMILPFKDRLIALNVVEWEDGSDIGTSSAGTGNFSGNIAGYVYKPGQLFIIGTTVFSIVSDTPGAQAMDVETVNINGNKATGTFDVTTGNVVITGNNTNPNLPVYWLPNSIPTYLDSEVYVNRVRFSQNGAPVTSNAWLETLAGRGGRLDAPTKEQIITSEFIKDRLIVYFEKSTWELVYTGNEILPFRWQQINTELGAESTFSSVPFDKVVLAIGDVGIHACNGANVERIDNKIPDNVFALSNNNNGVERIWGIRDFYVEQVYWAIPTIQALKFPNRVLVYNYKSGTWAYNVDSFTAFGNYDNQPNATWANYPIAWDDSVETWQSGTLYSNVRQIVAGNQEGFTCVIQPDLSINSMMLQVTNITYSGDIVTVVAINHNLSTEDTGINPIDYIMIDYADGITGINGIIVPVYQIVTDNSFKIKLSGVSGAYTGGGVIIRVSNISITSKQYNFYVEDGVNSFINKVDFQVQKTPSGAITVDYSVSSSTETQLYQGGSTGALLGNGVLDTGPYALVPLENSQERLWHPIYPQAEGEFIQLTMYYTDAQMRNPAISLVDFQLHAMIFYTSRTGRLQ
jgi:hypothetical protein